MELNELLGLEIDLRIPNHYNELSSDEMSRRILEIKNRRVRLFIPGHHYQKDEDRLCRCARRFLKTSSDLCGNMK